MPPASPAPPSTHPKPWEEKNPWIAGLLAYLIPGAGHIYQGRTVKGLIYFFSILGLFVWGQKLGEGMVVYNMPEQRGAFRRVTLSYAAQFGAGACSLPALIQNQRAGKPSNMVVHRLSKPFSAQFEGRLNPTDDPAKGKLLGTIRLEPVEGELGPEVKGTFEGTLDGQVTTINLGGNRFDLDRPIKAGFRRRLECSVDDGNRTSSRWIVGTVPRSFLDAYGSSPDPEQLQEINGRLGKIYELALVFTWIAGLLNILAIWDCVLGPAYGFGDEPIVVKETEARSVATSPVSESTKESVATGPEDAAKSENRPTQKSPV